MVMGAPGTGKTVLGNQLCFTTARRQGAAIYVTLLAESHDRLLANLHSLAFFDESLVSTRIHYLSGYGILEQTGIAGLLVSLQRLVTERQATMLVLDGFGALMDFVETEIEIKKFLQDFQYFASLTGCTTLILSGRKRAVDESVLSLADGVIELSHSLGSYRGGRELQITKSSGSKVLEGRHTYVISGEGFIAFPRREALAPAAADLPVHGNDDRIAFGIPMLDAMLDGGVVRGSSTLLQGPSGTGKTVFGLHFLGAAHNGPGVYFGYGTNAGDCLAMADGLGLDLRRRYEAGRLRVVVERNPETPVDVVATHILDCVTACGAARVFIDDLEHFEAPVAERGRIRPFLSSFTDALRSAGATTAMAIESTSRDKVNFESSIEIPSGFADNLICLRFRTLDDELQKTCSIVKMQRSGFDNHIRPFRITANGVIFERTGETSPPERIFRRRGWGFRHARAHPDR